MAGSVALVFLAIGVLLLAGIGYQLAERIKDATLREAVDMACRTAGGIAYYFLLTMTNSPTVTGQTALSRAIDLGLDHVTTAVPDSVKALRIPKQILEHKVKAELTRLLVQGPNDASPAVLRPMLSRKS